jgi:hypothetical protein
MIKPDERRTNYAYLALPAMYLPLVSLTTIPNICICPDRLSTF